MASEVTVKNAFPEFRAALQKALDDSVTAQALALSGEMKKNMGSEGGGVIGKTESGRNIYQASPVGAFPGVRRGGAGLIGSISSTKAVNGTASAGTIKRYGRWLEEGTEHMGARPWLWRSFQKAKGLMQRVGKSVFTKSMDQHFKGIK